jgi:pimeloyl-ACP methyl ester carboxylesterase
MIIEKKISVDGAEIFVKTCGKGDPILFIHGNPDSADMWDDYLREFSHKYMCISFDIPGFKRSGTPEGFDFSFESMGQFLAQFLEELGVSDKVTLVMHDFGGAYGLSYAVQFQDKIRSLVVSNTIVHSKYKWHFWGRVWRTPVVGELSMLLSSKWLFRFELSRSSEKLEKSWMDKCYEEFDKGTQKSVLKMYRAADPWKLEKWQEKLDSLYNEVPTIVLWGEKDAYIPIQFSKKFGDKVVVFPESGHWVTIEEQSGVIKEIEQHLAGV